MKKHIIDAKNRSLGRVSSEVAYALMGKLDPAYKREVVSDVKVEIINAKKTVISEKKAGLKRYKSFSGHPGGLKESTVNQILTKFGWEEVYKRTISRMIPKNKLHTPRLKNLIVKE